MPIPVIANPDSEILQLSHEKFRWKTAGKIDLLENLFDDELVFIHLNGHISSKKKWINELRSKRFIYQYIDQREASVKLYGDSAVLVGNAVFSVSMSSYSNTYHLVYTEVYAKKTGEWKLVNIHTCAY